MTAQGNGAGEFAGKVVLIAGGSNGIGKALSLAFAGAGAQVAVVASSSREKAAAVCQDIEAAGGTAKPFVANVADPGESVAMVADVVAAFGRIDVLVNSAGTHFATYIGETTEEEFDRMADVNFKGAYFLMNAVAPVMRKQGGGKIVHISASMSGVPFAGMAIYCASKAALDSLVASMAWELGPHGINCNAVAPGNTVTPEIAKAFASGLLDDVVEWTESVTPSRRKVSTAEDIANIVMFLASEKSSSLYGEVIVADEGMSKAWRGYLDNGLSIFPDSKGVRRNMKEGN